MGDPGGWRRLGPDDAKCLPSAEQMAVPSEMRGKCDRSHPRFRQRLETIACQLHCAGGGLKPESGKALDLPVEASAPPSGGARVLQERTFRTRTDEYVK